MKCEARSARRSTTGTALRVLRLVAEAFPKAPVVGADGGGVSVCGPWSVTFCTPPSWQAPWHLHQVLFSRVLPQRVPASIPPGSLTRWHCGLPVHQPLRRSLPLHCSQPLRHRPLRRGPLCCSRLKPVQRCLWPVQRCLWPVQRCLWPVQRCLWPVQRCLWPVQQRWARWAPPRARSGFAAWAASRNPTRRLPRAAASASGSLASAIPVARSSRRSCPLPRGHPSEVP